METGNDHLVRRAFFAGPYQDQAQEYAKGITRNRAYLAMMAEDDRRCAVVISSTSHRHRGLYSNHAQEDGTLNKAKPRFPYQEEKREKQESGHPPPLLHSMTSIALCANSYFLLQIPHAGSRSISRVDTSYCILDKFDVFPRTPMNLYAKSSIIADNAGGQSDISEAWSIHHLMGRLQASNCVLEMEIKYFMKYKMVDYILTVPSIKDDSSATRIGVSVTRAMCAPGLEYTRDKGVKLL